MEKRILNQQTLDDKMSKGCSTPGCKCEGVPQIEMFFVPNCHPGAGLDVKYNSLEGVVKLSCHKCEKPMDVIGVTESEVGLCFLPNSKPAS